MTDSADSLLQQAIQLHRSGDAQQAEPLYRQVLEYRPGDRETLYLLGTAQLQTSQFADCIATFSQVVNEGPPFADVHNNLGVAYKALGRWEEAARAFQEAVNADPDYQQGFYNLGVLMEDRGLLADAAKCYRHVMELNADDSMTRYRLANVLKDREEWQDAETCYRAVLEREPQNLDAQVNLGFVLTRQEKLDAAAGVYRDVLDVEPDFHQIHSNLCFVYERQGRFDEAIQHARQALELSPDDADALNNLGNALRSAQRLDEACDCFRKAIELRADFALAKFNEGTTRLLGGKYREGWPGYRMYAEAAGLPVRRWSQPRWNGRPIQGQRLLVFADQGFGDTLQFVRFLPQVKDRSRAAVILECQPELQRLLTGLPGVETILAEGEALPDFDVRVPLADVPGLLNVELESFSAKHPYLKAAASMRHSLRELFDRGESSGRRRVGLVWQGNPRQARDTVRSCPLERLAPLLDVPGLTFFSLQTDEAGRTQRGQQNLHQRLIDVGGQLRDFSDTAAVLNELDLLITVDTAAAHLAGALGRPVWTLLGYAPDWRWHLHRRDSPWYPTMRLYRQPSWGDWAAVLQQVAADLESFVSDPSE